MFDANDIKFLQIELTNQCNAACPACAREIKDFNFDSKLDKSEIGLDQFKKLFSAKFLKTIQKISFAGNYGDPIAAKDIYEIIDYIKRSNPLLEIGINTNGSLRNPDWWAKLGKLMRYSKDVVIWSIDGLEDTNHIYRKNTNWQKIMDNTDAFISAGGHAHWAMLIFDYNEHQVDQCMELSVTKGFEEFIGKVSNRHTIEIYEKAFPRRPKNFKSTDSVANNQIKCPALSDKSIYISAHGNILPCCHFGSKQYLKNYSSSHPNLLSKIDFDETKLPVIIDSFNEIVKTWDTDTPVDVCKLVCSYNYNDESYYKFIENQVAIHVVHNAKAINTAR